VSSQDFEWYASIDKPEWTPPPSVFPIVRTVLNAMIGLSSGLGVGNRYDCQIVTSLPQITAFVINRIVSFSWTPILFVRRDFELARRISAGLLISIAIMVTTYARSGGGLVSASLLVPYFAWSWGMKRSCRLSIFPDQQM